MQSISPCPPGIYHLLLGISYVEKRSPSKQEAMEHGEKKRETGDQQIASHAN